jgi:hypothetical protein
MGLRMGLAHGLAHRIGLIYKGSIGIQQVDVTYAERPPRIQATGLLGMALPVLLFFPSQRVSRRGVGITGVDV